MPKLDPACPARGQHRDYNSTVDQVRAVGRVNERDARRIAGRIVHCQWCCGPDQLKGLGPVLALMRRAS